MITMLATSAVDLRPNPRLPLGPRHVSQTCLPTQLLCAAPPERTAIRFRGIDYSYASIAAAVSDLAQQINESEATPAAPIIVHGMRGPELVIGIIASLASNHPFCIVDPTLPTSRQLTMAAAIQGDVLLRVGDPDCWTFPCLNGKTNLTVIDYVSAPAGLISRPHVSTAPTSRSTGYYLFTSGTTGQPKPVFTDMSPLSHFIDWHISSFKFNASDRFSMLSGLGHDPLLRDIFTPFACGGTLCIPDQELLISPTRALAWLSEEKVSVMHITPPLGRILCHQALGDSKTSEILRYTFFGGDTLFFGDIKSWRRFAPNCRCVNFYGATETPQAVAFHIVPETGDGQLARDRHQRVPIGKGIEGVQLLVMRPDATIADVGEPGEIWVRTPFLSLGYALAGECKSTSIANPYTGEFNDTVYRTGDYGSYNADGSVCCLGRKDDQIKIRGYRVELSEVAHHLRSLPGVADAVVLPVDDKEGLTLAAFFTKSREADFSAPTETLRSLLSQSIPEYMVPKRFTMVAHLPLGPNNKVDRNALLALIRHEPKQAPTRVNGSNRVEAAIISSWSQWLTVPNITAETDFILAGGDSLTAVAISSDIQSNYQICIDPPLFFKYRTPEAIAANVAEANVHRSAQSPSQTRSLSRSTQDKLERLRRSVEMWRAGPQQVPAALEYEMQKSAPAAALCRMLFASGRRSIQQLAVVLLLKSEGGACFTRTLRELFRQHHRMDIGDYSSYCFSVANFKPGTTFGRYCDITRTARFETANHPSATISSHGVFYQKGMRFSRGVDIPRNRIIVGHDVHIGHNVSVLFPTARIGTGAIIGAGAVVTTDVPEFAVVTGSPARIVRYRFSDAVINELLNIKWWEAPLCALHPVRELFEGPLEDEK